MCLVHQRASGAVTLIRSLDNSLAHWCTIAVWRRWLTAFAWCTSEPSAPSY